MMRYSRKLMKKTVTWTSGYIITPTARKASEKLVNTTHCHRWEKALVAFRDEFSVLKVISFNGGRYDIPLIADELMPCLAKQWKGFIKKGSTYMEIQTEELRILDMRNYIDQGYSADAYQQVADDSLKSDEIM